MSLDYESIPESEITSAIESIARRVVKRRLETPAILLLELHRPVSFLAGQALVVGAPFLGPIFGLDAVGQFGAIFNDRSNLDKLIQRIDELAASRGESAPPRKTEEDPA